MVFKATALLKPCFLKNNAKTALASFSAATGFGCVPLEVDNASIPESVSLYHEKIFRMLKRNAKLQTCIVLDSTWNQCSIIGFFKQKPELNPYHTLLDGKGGSQVKRVDSYGW